MKLLFLIFIFLLPLFADETLDDVLSEYEERNTLSNATKKENGGHIIAYSRADLDKMQAFTLNDVVKTIRFFTLQTKQNGLPVLTYGGNPQAVNFPLKIYINTHELSSTTLENALVQYGKMALSFVDHIEIYQGANSVVFGNEPAAMIIKLYIKEPSRENSTSLQFSANTQGGVSFQAVDAQSHGEYSYLATVDLRNAEFEDRQINGYDYLRDGKRAQLYTKFSKNGVYDIEFEASHEDYDAFRGQGVAPLDNNLKSDNIYIQTTNYFSGDIKLLLSATYESLDFFNKDALGIRLWDNTLTNHLKNHNSAQTYSGALEKKSTFENDELTYGAQLKYSKLKVHQYEADGVAQNYNYGPESLMIYMLYAENIYHIDKNNLISLGAKLDYYHDGLGKDSLEHILSLGFVSILSDSIKFKAFLVDGYQYPTMYQTTFFPTRNPNPSLDASNIQTYTAELIYDITSKTVLNFGIGFATVDDVAVYDYVNNIYVNKTKTNDFTTGFIKLSHKFDANNKINIEFFNMHKKDDYSPKRGAFVQIFNRVGFVDIYNELICRDDYKTVLGTKVDAGYEYTLGVAYPYSQHTNLKLKGENLLDRASGTMYGGENIPITERKVIASLEYTF